MLRSTAKKIFRTAGRLTGRPTGPGIQSSVILLEKRNDAGIPTIWRRDAHNGSIYVQHATVGSSVNSAAVTLGLIHSLSVLCPGLGYFRPIDSTTHGGDRAKLVHAVYKLPGNINDMKGCSQEEAYTFLDQEKVDDLIDHILRAYETYKASHDFVVVEGSSLRDGFNSTALNGQIAAALGCSALLVADAEAASRGLWSKGKENVGESNGTSWEAEVCHSLLESQHGLKKENVDTLASLVYRVPRTSRGDSTLKKLLEEMHLPYVGYMPVDDTLQAIQVHDVRRVLGAELPYGEAADALSQEVSEHVVATLHTGDLLEHLLADYDPHRGKIVISHRSRPDVLLAMVDLHESHLPSSLAAVVLTGGETVADNMDALIRARRQPTTLPILVAPSLTYETCLAISGAEAEISPSSTRKIERAQVLFEEHVNAKLLNAILFKEREVKMNPKLFQYTLFQKAKESQQHIVLPEGEEPRTIAAAAEILRRGLCQLTLLGKEEKIRLAAKSQHVDLGSVRIVDPATAPELKTYSDLLFELRKSKGMTREQAEELMLDDVNYFGTAMVGSGHADGMVSGAIHTTANTVRPALQIIKTHPSTPIVSSVFFMCLPTQILVYGDCAINTDPSSSDLAAIAISSADTAAAFGIEPRVAMLSYATGDSNQGPLIKKVADAVVIAKERRPDLVIEGPLQYDAAVNPETARTKMKGKESAVAGRATVLIFPDLNTGNNTYKAVQQSTGAIAMGPVLQGLRKPVNDLSRGCTVQDIVTTIALTAVLAGARKTAPLAGPAA